MIRVKHVALIVGLLVACSDAFAQQRTYIDPGNTARIGEYVGSPGGKLCIAAVYVDDGTDATVRLWRDADPGGKKDLDMMTGRRRL